MRLKIEEEEEKVVGDCGGGKGDRLCVSLSPGRKSQVAKVVSSSPQFSPALLLLCSLFGGAVRVEGGGEGRREGGKVDGRWIMEVWMFELFWMFGMDLLRAAVWVWVWGGANRTAAAAAVVVELGSMVCGGMRVRRLWWWR